MKAPKVCRTCGEEKDISQFRRLGRLMVERSGNGLTHSHDCKVCRLKAKVMAMNEGAGAEVIQTDDAAPKDKGAKLSMPMCMAVEIEFDGVDFVLQQDNDGTTHTIYMAPHVLRGMWEWAHGLAQNQAGASA